MTRETEIMNLLLDRYERSGHCLPGKESNRRIMLNLTKGELDSYRENDPNVAEVNSAIETLTADLLVTAIWRKGYEGWLYDRVVLNLYELAKAYERAGREPLAMKAGIIAGILIGAKSFLQSPWKLKFLDDEIARLQATLRPSRLLTMDETVVESIVKVLKYTEKGPELMRVISANCFNDSKYLEQNTASHLSSIAKAYEPDLVAYHTLDDERLTQSVVLEQIGILTYPEILEFCGSVRLSFGNSIMSTDVFRNGFCIQSENFRFLTGADISDIRTLIFIENRTNYRQYILRGAAPDTLVIYHGGFYSPAKGRLFNILSEGASPTARTLFWGDIDLGGFLMFTRLKREFFPNLAAWRMGSEDFEKHKAFGLKRSSTYLELIRKKMRDDQFDAIFYPVAQLILQSGVTIEQELML